MAMLPCLAFAGITDYVVDFSTPGVDRYADGTIVADGECYALVWSPKGTVFSGFNADGTPVSPRDCVVLAAPLAQKGRCPSVIFQVPAEEYEMLKGGEWSVCLVDTRRANGVPAGAVDNMPLRVNRWGTVKSGVKLEPVEVSKMKAASSSTGGTRSSATATGATGGTRAGILSAVPDAVKQPQVTFIDVSGEDVVLTVADTVPYLSYTIVSGSEPGSLGKDRSADVVDGDDGVEIEIGTAKSDDRRFFKVTRAE